MSGEIVAQTVDVQKKGALEGDVTAKAISVDKGGMFSGQLVIGRADLTQGELLQEQKPDVGPVLDNDFSGVSPRPLHAT
jgi:cytoskeletal protein CcmA (bactofilin family)